MRARRWLRKPKSSGGARAAALSVDALEEVTEDARDLRFRRLPLLRIPLRLEIVVGPLLDHVVVEFGAGNEARDLARGRRRMDAVVAGNDAGGGADGAQLGLGGADHRQL